MNKISPAIEMSMLQMTDKAGIAIGSAMWIALMCTILPPKHVEYKGDKTYYTCIAGETWYGVHKGNIRKLTTKLGSVKCKRETP